MNKLTHSITQNILVPLNLHTLSKSNSLIYKSQAKQTRNELLLNDKIKRMYIGFEKIGLPIHGFTDYAFFLTRVFLPSEIPVISGKTWLHASILLITEKGYNICLEYGGYDGEDMIDKKKRVILLIIGLNIDMELDMLKWIIMIIKMKS